MTIDAGREMLLMVAYPQPLKHFLAPPYIPHVVMVLRDGYWEPPLRALLERRGDPPPPK